jgi:hypothetical protein
MTAARRLSDRNERARQIRFSNVAVLQSVKGGAEPFLIHRPDQRHGFHLAVDRGNQSHDPAYEHEYVKDGYQYPADDGNENENEQDKPRKNKSEHLPEMKRPELCLFVAVYDDGCNEADQCEVADDCNRFVFPAAAGGGVCAVSIAGFLSFFGFAKNDSADAIAKARRVKR